MHSLTNILIALPAYNEAQIIGSVISDIKALNFHNIIVINDGSTDHTSDVLKTLDIKELKLPINRGVGAAMKTAILYARINGFDQLLLMDSDGQHYPSDIQILYQKMITSKADMVIGSRFHQERSEIPTTRRIFNKIANWVTLLGNIKVDDSQSGFRLLNRKAIEKLDLELDDYAVCTEMIWKCKKEGLIISEAPIKVKYTKYSMSKGQNLFKGIKTGLSLIRKVK